jgi:hypothetical protein
MRCRYVLCWLANSFVIYYATVADVKGLGGGQGVEGS